MANFVFNRGKLGLIRGSGTQIDVSSDTINVLLCNSGYTPDPDDNFVSDIAGEITGVTNYSRKTLASFTITEDDANDRVNIDCDDVTWTALGGASNDTITSIIVFRQITNDADSPLLCHIDTSTGFPSLPFTTNGGDLTLNISDLIRLLNS